MTHADRQTMLRSLSSDVSGLSEAGIVSARKNFGWNEIPEKREPLWRLLLAQFRDVMVYILLGAVAVSVLVPYLNHGAIHRDELLNGIVILAIVFLNALFGFAQEWRAGNAIASLRKLSAPSVRVRRGGQVMMVPGRELVPGDLVIFEAGDRVSADARIVASSSAEVDESSLTGESVPVSKSALSKIEKGFHFSPGMLYSSTLFTRGSAEAVVTATGLGTEIGKITSMVMNLKPPPTPLQQELKRTGSQIGVLVLGLCTFLFIIGLLRGIDSIELFFTAVSLAVAAVPEGLPAVVTICLAIGVQRMIKKNALVRKLDAVETLGNVNVICADKTGTMTENRMEVTETVLADGAKEKRLALAAASCNRAELPDIGDPTEIALLKHAEGMGVTRSDIDEEEVPFTSEAKYMVTRHTVDGVSVKFFKGAPEVMARFFSKNEEDFVRTSAEKLSKKGLRVLAVAEDDGGGVKLLGMLAMMDPPRAGVLDAVRRAETAGIRTVMITGDHPATARSVADAVGIRTEGALTGAEIEALDDEGLARALRTISVFARVQPKHKVRILESLQSSGNVVAMSGDGVNDAPALKRAHVGIGMGRKGTDVAREAAAIVLTDDDYSTIVRAVAEGRRIYDNIRKFVIFLIRSNVGEVMTIAAAILFGMPLPLLPLHILWVNLVTDSLPALALAAEPAAPGLMERPPRSRTEGIFAGEWVLLLMAGLCNAVLSLAAFGFTLTQFPGELVLARTAALTTTIIYQLFLACSTRTELPIWRDLPFKNPLLLLAIATSVSLQFVLLLTPLSSFFSVQPLPAILWEEILLGSLAAFGLFEVLKSVHGPSVRSRLQHA